jgi:hypothetical protein
VVLTSLIPTTDHIHAIPGTQNGDPHTHIRKVLFFTNAESEANTILAMVLEALTRPHFEVHIASFPILNRHTEGLSPELNFHALDDVNVLKALVAQGFSEEMVSTSHTFRRAKALRPTTGPLHCW